MLSDLWSVPSCPQTHVLGLLVAWKTLVQTMHGEFHCSSAGKSSSVTSTWPRGLLASALLKLGETDAHLSAILLSPGQSFWLTQILMSFEVQPKLLSMHTYVTKFLCPLLLQVLSGHQQNILMIHVFQPCPVELHLHKGLLLKSS